MSSRECAALQIRLFLRPFSVFRGDNINITPVELLIGIPSNILLAVRERKAIQLKTWLPLAVMVIVGSIPGIFLLKFGDAAFLKLILGAAIIGIGIKMLLREHQHNRYFIISDQFGLNPCYNTKYKGGMHHNGR